MRAQISLTEIRPRRIALVKPSALGDIAHSLPVLSALRRRFPEAHITWVVNRAFEPLLRGHPHLDATLAFDRGASKRGWWAGAAHFNWFFGELRRQRFDLLVDLQGLLRTGLMAGASGASRRVGLSTAREGASWFYTDRVAVPEPKNLHAVDRYWLVARALGIDGDPPAFCLPVSDETARWAEDVLNELPRPFYLVGPGSRWLTKRWPPEHFAALIGRAQAEFGGSAILVGGGDEAGLSQAVSNRLQGPCRDFTGKTTLPQLAALLDRADVMVANDTGPLHLAVALGRPVVAPYTCTKVRLTGPYRAAGGAVESKVWCQGSCRKTCSRMECMAELTPDRLWPLLHEVLTTWQKHARSA